MRSAPPLRATFAAAILFAYVAIGVLTVIGFLLSVRSIDQVFAVRFAQTQALLEKSRILSRIDREVALASKLADDPIVQLWAVSEDDPRLKSLAMQELESYRRSFTDHSYFIAPLASLHYYIRTASSPGDRVQVTTLNPNLAADAWYFQTLRNVDSFALNVDFDRVIQAAKVWINVVLRDASGKKIGIGGTGIDISDFIGSILRPADSRTITILFDGAGVIQAHPNTSYVLRNAGAKLSAKLTVFDLLSIPEQGDSLRAAISDLAGARTEVAAMPLTVEGRSYQAALSAMPGIGWFNLVLVDVSRVLRVGDYLPLAGTLLASLLLLLLVIVLILSRAVLRPLSALAAASREIAGGRYGIQIPPARSAEMGQLTNAFNSMSATVKSRTDGLESRIMESLDYAQRVQASMLPGPEALARIVPENLVIYLPRDVVGGDFYFVRKFHDHFVAAVIDCMGHGVPGAFMSMTVHAVLSHVLDAVCSDDPARIIAELDRNLRDTLHRDTEDKRLDAGLDIAICVCSPVAGTVTFAGSGLPLFLWDGSAAIEVKGDHRRVGYRSPGTGSAWVNHSISLGTPTTLYLVTDGYLDQAGGERGFGFGRQRFIELIGRNAALPLREQESAIRDALSAYRGAHPQRDDITVIGFRIAKGAKE